MVRSPVPRAPAWSGAEAGLFLGLGQPLRWRSWRSSDPLAWGRALLVWWLSLALPTVLSHLPGLLSGAGSPTPSWDKASWELA